MFIITIFVASTIIFFLPRLTGQNPLEEKFYQEAQRGGFLEDVDEIYGVHVFPLYPVGKYATCPGPMLAQSDTFEISITGRGGHAAFPHLTVDPIVIGTEFVNAAQSIVSRNVDPLDSAVVSITEFHGGEAKNVIPPSVTLGGTVRTLDKEVNVRVRSQLENLLDGIVNAHNGTHTFSYREGCPVTYNHDPCVESVLTSAHSLVGEENVIYPISPILGGEDFAYYSEQIPACFVMVGAGNEEKGIVNMCHHPQFDIDENCMIYGMALTASLGLMQN